MKNLLLFGFSALLVAACYDNSSIRIQNKLPKATVHNVEWGGVPLASQILPGQTSPSRAIPYKSSYYETKLPEAHVLKFYIDLNGDKVYVQTKEEYRLGIEEDITIVIDTATKIVNPSLSTE